MKVMWIWSLSQHLMHTILTLLKMMWDEGLCDEMKWGGWPRQCDIALGYSDLLTIGHKEDHRLLDWGWLWATETSESKTMGKEGTIILEFLGGLCYLSQSFQSSKANTCPQAHIPITHWTHQSGHEVGLRTVCHFYTLSLSPCTINSKNLFVGSLVYCHFPLLYWKLHGNSVNQNVRSRSLSTSVIVWCFSWFRNTWTTSSGITYMEFVRWALLGAKGSKTASLNPES